MKRFQAPGAGGVKSGCWILASTPALRRWAMELEVLRCFIAEIDPEVIANGNDRVMIGLQLWGL